MKFSSAIAYIYITKTNGTLGDHVTNKWCKHVYKNLMTKKEQVNIYEQWELSLFVPITVKYLVWSHGRALTIENPNTFQVSYITRPVDDSSRIGIRLIYSHFILQSKIFAHNAMCYLFTGALKLYKVVPENTAGEVFLSWTSFIPLSTDPGITFSCHIEPFLLSLTLVHRLSPKSILFNSNSSFTSFIPSTTPMLSRCLAATQDEITMSIFPFLSFRVGDFVQAIHLNKHVS